MVWGFPNPSKGLSAELSTGAESCLAAGRKKGDVRSKREGKIQNISYSCSLLLTIYYLLLYGRNG